MLGAMWLAGLLLLAAPTYDSFDSALDPARWYIGVGAAPRKGVLRLPKGGWIVSRNIPDESLESIEVVFRGELELTFHSAQEPLAAPQGDPLRLKKGKGVRTLVITGTGATLDGEPLPWKGKPRGTFRLASPKGNAVLEEVRVAPRTPAPPGG